ncbi:Hypothetical predicted protein, partial [Paramuricea clavata]
ATLSMFNGNMMITAVYETVIKKIDEEMNVATANRARPASNAMSLQLNNSSWHQR